MLKLRRELISAGGHRLGAVHLSKRAEAVAATLTSALPPALIRIHYRFLVGNLQRHGVSDLYEACALSERYIAVLEDMISPPLEAKWRQVMLAGHMREEQKVKALNRVLARAENRAAGEG